METSNAKGEDYISSAIPPWATAPTVHRDKKRRRPEDIDRRLLHTHRTEDSMGCL
jgi:hypothetical protein